VLPELFTKASRGDFSSTYLRKAPFAEPDSARAFTPLFDWSALDRVLKWPGRNPDADSDVLVVKQGRLVPAPTPRTLGDARTLLDTGSSLVIRRAERRDAALSELAQRFERACSGVAHIQLFVTPKGERGFGWHYHAEEVFILQTRGTKEYFLRRNTMNPNPVPQPHYDFAPVSRERTPLMAGTLVAGDWLYIPSGWWHAATAREDSLSISVGVLGVHA
jgi:ribosomal protein L16 Arg81 hydroxylase